MPVLSERGDIVVITDEAHRSQYDTMAANMRLALPNASFLGFTGTPLIAGEEETRRVFGDYVSIYNFRDSIADGATVPLYYENRIPELQLTNDDFDDELEDLLEEAALDDAQEKAVARRFSKQYELITRPQRLAEIAENLVHHFVNRGFRGKAMYVAIDKATAVRMYDLVEAEWARYLAELEDRLAGTPVLERPHLESLIEFMRSTDMAVVVSQAQNEVADMAAAGLDIAKHRQADSQRGPRLQVQGPRRPVPAGVRVRHVAHRVRLAVNIVGVSRQADAQPPADADHRPSQPGVPRTRTTVSSSTTWACSATSRRPSPSTAPTAPHPASTPPSDPRTT